MSVEFRTLQPAIGRAVLTTSKLKNNCPARAMKPGGSKTYAVLFVVARSLQQFVFLVALIYAILHKDRFEFVITFMKGQCSQHYTQIRDIVGY